MVGLGGTERNVVGDCKEEMDAPSQWRKIDWIGSPTKTTAHDIAPLWRMEDIFGIRSQLLWPLLKDDCHEINAKPIVTQKGQARYGNASPNMV